jgi:hypothetical protein
MRKKIETKPDATQTVRDLGALSPKWDVFLISLPSATREPFRRGCRKTVRLEGTEDTKKTRPLNQHEQSTQNSRDWGSLHSSVPGFPVCIVA